MKTLALIIIALFLAVPAMAQDVDQQIQQANIKIIQLGAQRDYNNALILDLNRKALNFDQQIQQQRDILQQLMSKKAVKTEVEGEK